MRDYDALSIVYQYKSFARLKYFLELGYSEKDWKDALSSLQARGLLTKAGALSPTFKDWYYGRNMQSGFSTCEAIKEEFFNFLSTDLTKALQ
jgi:hypothetical protein